MKISKWTIFLLSLWIICAMGDEELNPGAISIYLDTKSLNNIANSLVPVMLYMQVRNQTFEIDFLKNSNGLETYLKSIYFKEISSGKPFIGFVEGTDTLRIAVPNINTEIDIIGEVDLFQMIHLGFYYAIVKDLAYSMDLTIEKFENHPW